MISGSGIRRTSASTDGLVRGLEVTDTGGVLKIDHGRLARPRGSQVGSRRLQVREGQVGGLDAIVDVVVDNYMLIDATMTGKTTAEILAAGLEMERIFLKSIKPERLEGSEQREVNLQMRRPTSKMTT